MRNIKTIFGRDLAAEEPTPLQKGLKKATSLNYYDLEPLQEESVDRMRNIGLLWVDLDGTIIPTKMGKEIIDGTVKTRNGTPPFLAGLV